MAENTSVISSRMTDVSDDGDDYRMSTSTARPTTSTRPLSSRSPLGQSVGDGSRPSTGISSQPATSSQPPPSRRGPGGMGGTRGSIGVASTSGSTAPPRPLTSASRTHVPSLTSHAFFKPMSSQRLQAQRNVRAPVEASAPKDEDDDMEGNASRYSFGSNPTTQYGTTAPQAHDPMPQSRDTNLSDRNGLGTASGPPGGRDASRSLSESVRPLQNRTATGGKGLNAPGSRGTANSSPRAKSQRSFRSSFRMPSRGGNTHPVERGREKLSSGDSSPKFAADKIAVVKKNLGKNHEYFTGNTAFCWGGRLQNTRDRPVNLLTGLLIILPSALFSAFSAPYLWKNVSPAIPIVFAYLFAVCMSSFIHASLSDPGILPRNLHPFPPTNPRDDPLTLGPSMNGWAIIKGLTPSRGTSEVPTKYCKTCNIWRPVRAHHCRICDNCIETQDHHCVWLNNCVGRRNYRFFFAFVTSATLLALFLVGASLGHCLQYRASHGIPFGAAIRQCRIPFSMFVYGALAFPYPASLLGYHLYLMGRGETTREYLSSFQFLKKDRHRPFTTGNLLKNWVNVLVRPRPPTYLHFKRQYEEGDQRFAPTRGKRTTPLPQEQQGGGMEMGPVRPRTPEAAKTGHVS